MRLSKLFELLIVPSVIGIVGVIGTVIITQQQIKTTEILSRTQLESTEKLTKSDQQIKIIEIFSEKITSDDVREREIAVRILSSLDPVLADKLMKAIADSENENKEIRTIAQNIITEEKKKGFSFAIIGSFLKLSDAIAYANSLTKKELPYQLHIYEGRKGYFAVCLDGNLSREEAISRVEFAKKNKIAEDAYVHTTENWDKNLFK